MKITYQEITRIKKAIEQIAIEFAPKNLPTIVTVVSETARVSKEKARHVLCCGNVMETGCGFQYSMPSTKQCLTDAFETKMTYFDTLLENNEREEMVEINNVYSA